MEQSESSDLLSQLREAQLSLRAQKLTYEERLLELHQQLSQSNSEKAHLALQLKLLSSIPTRQEESIVEGLKTQVRALTQDLENTRNEYKDRTTETSAQTKRLFEELKAMYEEENKRVKLECQRLTAEVYELRETVEKSSDGLVEIEEIRKEKQGLEAQCEFFEQKIKELQEELQAEKASSEEHQSFMQARMDTTRRMLEFASTTSLEVRKLKGIVRNLRETVAGFEENDRNWRSQLEEKETEISNLRGRLSQVSFGAADQKVNELQEEVVRLHSQLTRKDTQIASLQERIALKKLDEGFDGSHSLVSETELRGLQACKKMVASATAFECAGCRHIIAIEGFAEHARLCLAESIEQSDLPHKSTSFTPNSEENAVKEMKISLGEANNERDKAQLECEKLRLQLMHLTEEWTRAEDREAELGEMVRRMYEGLQTGMQTKEVAKMARKCLERGQRQQTKALNRASL